jgi:hypothetical protein
MGGEQRFSKSPRDVDFSNFRTIDAVDLPGAVNTICAKPLSDRFIQTYNQIRALRNKITHLGQTRDPFDPDEMIRVLVFQYTELWKDRAWLHDVRTYGGNARVAGCCQKIIFGTVQVVVWLFKR